LRQSECVAEAIRWLVLVYRIPSEPSRLRAGVWRKLKGHGAIYLQSSAAALPASPASERAMRSLRNEIVQIGGTAQLLDATALVGERDIVAAFNAARDEEYAEILARCDDFLAEIDDETAKEHFTYAELEENDEDLTKLKGWLAKVVDRDALAASRRPSAQTALQRCEEALAGFAERVYARDSGDAHQPPA
jgi:tRNA threonylcarbamoyladenosine modification (KEOPS) complex Cgi121 subunit